MQGLRPRLTLERSVLLSTTLYWLWRLVGGDRDAMAGAFPAAVILPGMSVVTCRPFSTSHFQNVMSGAVWWSGIVGGVCATLNKTLCCLQRPVQVIGLMKYFSGSQKSLKNLPVALSPAPCRKSFQLEGSLRIRKQWCCVKLALKVGIGQLFFKVRGWRYEHVKVV